MKLPLSAFDIITVKCNFFLSLAWNMIKSILLYSKYNILHYIYIF